MGKLGATYLQGTVFAPRQYLFHKEATGMGSLKMSSLCRCRKRTRRYGPPNYQDSFIAVFGREWKFGKIGGYLSTRYRVCTKAMFISIGIYIRERTLRYGPPNYQASFIAACTREWKFGEIGGYLSPRYRACTKVMFISKGSCAFGEPKNVIAVSVQKKHSS